MNVHYFQHVPFEGLGYIETWLIENHHIITSTKFFEASYKIPSLSEIDYLIIMGGPMSVRDESEYPWLKEEKDFIKETIKAGVKILGICFGAQLLADVLGSKIYTNSEKEIGWFEVRINSSFGNYLPHLKLPLNAKVFHWHGETFILPDGAINHATSKACKNQLFTVGKNIMGIQFHFEASEKTVGDMVLNCSSELIEGKYIQSSDEILKNKDDFLYSHELLNNILNKLFS